MDTNVVAATLSGLVDNEKPSVVVVPEFVDRFKQINCSALSP